MEPKLVTEMDQECSTDRDPPTPLACSVYSRPVRMAEQIEERIASGKSACALVKVVV